jgi:hypothetical protein
MGLFGENTANQKTHHVERGGQTDQQTDLTLKTKFRGGGPAIRTCQATYAVARTGALMGTEVTFQTHLHSLSCHSRRVDREGGRVTWNKLMWFPGLVPSQT